jgi:hypothetical protein
MSEKINTNVFIRSLQQDDMFKSWLASLASVDKIPELHKDCIDYGDYFGETTNGES